MGTESATSLGFPRIESGVSTNLQPPRNRKD